MDYSLLVGVHRTVYQHDRDTLQLELGRHAGAALANQSSGLLSPRSLSGNITTDINKAYVPSEFEAPVAFYFGVIDILQRWSWKKVGERWLKMGLKCLDGDGLSAVEPVTYQDRFTRRVIDVVVRGASGRDSTGVGVSDRSVSSRSGSGVVIQA
jgi:hypothetical protein